MTRLRQLMIEELQRRNFAETTIRSYVHGVEHFSRYFHRRPDQLGPEHIRHYQAMLFSKLKYSPNTVTLRLASLRFFYIQVLKKGWSIAETPYPKKVIHLPQILTPEEVAQLIDAAELPFYRILLMTMYGTGARRAASDFMDRIEPPLSLESEEWAEDYNLTKSYGALNGSLRTPEQTEIGLFWSAPPQSLFSSGLRNLIADQKLDTAQSARLAVMANVSIADATIACFNAKYHYAFWRPFTAIHDADTDGNPGTIADPNWLPLDITPGHPEYPAAHGCATEALTVALRSFFGSNKVHFRVFSSVTGTTHEFRRFSDVVIEVDEARIFGGMHFRHSVLQGNVLGKAVANHVLRTHFRNAGD